jgi:hypothetical protein
MKEFREGGIIDGSNKKMIITNLKLLRKISESG